MPQQISRNASSKSGNAGTKMQPWQIALLVVAALFVAWRVIGYVGEQRAANNITKQEERRYEGPAPKGSVQERRELEK